MSSSSRHILELPCDVLILILRELSISSLLSVQQTCRVLHALCSSDYIWHTINLDLPLNIGPHGNVESLSGSELRRLAVNALRVDHNWGRPHAILRGIRHIHHGGIISEMHLLSSEWLVTLSRTSTGGASVLSVWNIRQNSLVNTVRVVLEALHSPKLATCFQNAGTELLVAVYFCSASRRELLRVYNFPLTKNDSDSPSNSSRYLVIQLSGKDIQATAFEAHICREVVAVGLAQFDNVFDPPKYRILLTDIDTGFYYLAQLHSPEPLSQMHFRLFPGILIVTGIHQGNLVLYKYGIAHLNFTSSETSEVVQLAPPVEEFSSPVKVPSSPGFDYILSAENFSRSLTSMAALTYHQSPTFLHIIRFPLKQARYREVLAHKLPCHSGSAIDIICVGHSGQRAVWLERRWDTDAFVLMKGSFPSGGDREPSVSTLVPPYIALPFEFHACQSLAFDEATGRVCVGLHTGDLYLLDF